MRIVFSYFIILVLAGCTLSENFKKEEAKEYNDIVHEVKLVDYEFEERLNSFYESEPIESKDLYNLYEGEFPEGERNPQKLRIHWKDARELALAELELQKPIHSSWKDATISERPILVLDKDGGDFYRYYEYRLVKDKKFLGAIRIPAYRRTENFATAEVHLYSSDEKTYTIHPTGWGQYIADNSSLDIDGQFIQSINYSNNINKNFIYTIMLNYLSDKFDSNTHSLPQIPDHIAQESMNSMIGAFERNNDAIKELRSRHKGDELPGFVHDKAKDYYKRNNITQYKEGLSKYAKVMAKYDTLINVMNVPDLDSENKINLDKFFQISYLEFIKGYIQLMVSSNKYDVITKILRNFYWIQLEKISYDQNKMLLQKYSIDEIAKDNNISPYVTSKEFEKTEFLQEQNIVELLLTVIPQKIGFTIDSQNYTIMTFIPPTENKRGIDRDQALDFLQGNLDKINQNINNAIDKDNTDDFNTLLDVVHNLTLKSIRAALDTWNPSFDQLEDLIMNLFRGPAGKSIVKSYTKGVLTALLKNMDLIGSFVHNISPITSGCIKLSAINKNLQANGIEKISEKDGRDIWFLERMCAIIKQSVGNLKDFDKDKPIESLVNLVGPILKEYMESIYYAMSRSCDKWDIPPTYGGLPGMAPDDINEIVSKIVITIEEKEGEPYHIRLKDIYSINMEGTLGALHHSWSKKTFYPIKTSFISTRGAFCYWRYAWPKKRYGWSTYTDW